MWRYLRLYRKGVETNTNCPSQPFEPFEWLAQLAVSLIPNKTFVEHNKWIMSKNVRKIVKLIGKCWKIWKMSKKRLGDLYDRMTIVMFMTWLDLGIKKKIPRDILKRQRILTETFKSGAKQILNKITLLLRWTWLTLEEKMTDKVDKVIQSAF